MVYAAKTAHVQIQKKLHDRINIYIASYCVQTNNHMRADDKIHARV